MRTNRRIRGMGLALAASMAVTEGLLISQGRWPEAIPLHLCSVAALAAFAAAMGWGGDGIADFLWYLGLPGAVLALAFPAPAQSRHQALFTASYVVTHLLIVLVPLALMRAGRRPRAGRTLRVMLGLQGLALTAGSVNRMLGTNFLFLSAPPAGSPLVFVFSRGYPLYLLTLEAMMLALCLLQGALLRAFARRPVSAQLTFSA